jgi:hypothetical protein
MGPYPEPNPRTGTPSGFQKAVSIVTLSHFKHRLVDRVRTLAVEFGANDFVFPIVLVLAIDEQYGGDSTAKELVRRFPLLEFESHNALDFYFLGWQLRNPLDPSKGIEFDLPAFEDCREALRRVGIATFGGNADIVVLDARYEQPNVFLDFTQALHINLSDAVKNNSVENLGSFLQGMIDTANSLRNADIQGSDALTFRLSDKLGLAVARKSILAFILEKWGALIGAKKLQILATRRLGPRVNLVDL